MKQIARIIFLFLMISAPCGFAQATDFDTMDSAEMAAMEAEMEAAAGGLIAILLGMGAVFFGVLFVVTIFIMICQWKVLAKTGRPGALALLNLIGLGIVPLIMNCIDMKKIDRGVGSILGMILIPVIMYPIIAFSKKGADTSASDGGDTLVFDEPETGEQAVANRLAGPPVAAGNRKGDNSFNGATAFTVLAILSFLLFVGVIVLQTMEILYLDGTLDNDNSIWPAP